MDMFKPAFEQMYSLSEKVGELKNWRQYFFTAIAVLASARMQN